MTDCNRSICNDAPPGGRISPGRSIRIMAAALLALGAPLAVQADGAWRVTGVQAGDILNMRMGPGTEYPVIDGLAPDARGLLQVTCVPLPSAPQHDAALPDWCLVQSMDGSHSGWVARRFLAADDSAPWSVPAAGPDMVSPDMTSADEADPDGWTITGAGQRFMQSYAEQDPFQLIDRIEAMLPPSDSALLPYGQIDPLPLAVMMLEAGEGTRDRVRFRISWAIEPVPNPPKASPLPVSFIQIDRFSVGGAIRAELAAAHGADIVAPPEAFDVGPHVSWRFVTSPIMGIAAQVHAAGRAEIPDAEAAMMTCLGSPCLTPGMVLDEAAPWGNYEEMPFELDVKYPTQRGMLPTPAAALERLLEAEAFQQPELYREIPGPAEPFLEAVIEINLAPDTAMAAAMRLGGMMDDSLAALWRQLAFLPKDAGPPGLIRWELWECHRGPLFPPPGGLCP